MKKFYFFLLIPLLFFSFSIQGQNVGVVTYDFKDGIIIGAGQSGDGLLTLGGTYSHHGTTYGLNAKVDATISIQVAGSCTVRFLGSQYSSLDVKGTAVDDGDLGTQVGMVTNDLSDTFDFVYSGQAATLTFTTVAATGNDLYLPSIEVIPVQAGKDFTQAEKNVAYYFDLRDESIYPAGAGNHVEAGLIVIDAGCCNGISLNGSQHGITFKDQNTITLQVAGNTKIRVAGDQYSGGSIAASSTTGAFDISEQPHMTSVTYPQGADGGPWVDFTYVGDAGTVVLTGVGSTNYIPYIELSPIPYDISLNSYIQKSGTVTLNGVDINLTSGATSADNAAITVSAGVVISETNNTGMIAIDLGGADLSTLTPSVSGDIASASINGNDLDITYADGASDPTTFTIELFDNSYLHDTVTYDFKDGTIISNQQSADGKLTLGGAYIHHGTQYGLDLKVDQTISIDVDGSCTVRFLGSQYSGLDVKGTAVDDGDLGTQVGVVVNDLSDTFDIVYSGPARTLTFTTVAASGNDLYLPQIEVIPAQFGVAYLSNESNIPYYFDFRDQTIVPQDAPGNVTIEKGLVKVESGASNAYGFHSAQHGLNYKTGNIITLQVSGNSKIRLAGDQYSGATVVASVTTGTGSFDIAEQPHATAVTYPQGADGGPWVDFVYVGTAGTLSFEATGQNYLPYIEVSPIPYDISLTPWVQRSGTITINGTEITFLGGADAAEAAGISFTIGDGTVFSATNESASIEIDLGGTDLSSFTPALTGDIASTSVNGNELTITFTDDGNDPTSYIINISDSSAVVTANPGETYAYNFADGSEMPQTSYTSLRYETFKTADGILTMNSNTTDEAGQFGYHDSSHGGVFFPGNSFEMIVAGDATITFIVDKYGVADDAVFEFRDTNGTVIGEIPAQNIADGTDGVPVNFSYEGPAGTITATLVSAGYPTAEIYLHGMSIENAAEIEPSNGKIDVWDFGAEQLDVNLYNNKLDETKINAWYDGAITPGSSGNVLPSSWTEGVLSWFGGGNDRLRTSNTNLTRYDESSVVSGYNGRIYVNSAGATGRYMSLTLSEDDEVTLAMLAQSAGGEIHFTYVPDPEAQDDVVNVNTSSSITMVNFVAKAAGNYRIYDSADKPSYFRVERKDATYKTLTGNVDVTQAAGIPGNYEIVFTNAAGKSWSVAPSSGTYSIDLPQDYNYDLSLANANGYVISTANTILVEESTASFDVDIQQVELYTVSGAITGLGSEISNAVITYTPDPAANKIFMPEPMIDTGASTYTVQLEPNVEYTISAEGVNDFEIVSNTIIIGNADQSADIAFTLKPLYNVTINAPGLDATQLSKLELTFNNLNEAGYTYNFTDVSTVALRDGVYTIDYAGLDEYPIELALTSNLNVFGADTSKDLMFNPVTEWSFDDKVILNTDLYYKGLALSGMQNEIAKGHIVGGDTDTMTVPLNPGEKMIVTYYYSAEFSIEGGDPVTTNTGSTSNFETVEYVYPGGSPGTATITCSGGTTYFTNISVRPVVAFSDVITVGTDKDYQTINAALNAIAEMDRPNDERVTVLIDPANYEEMIVIRNNNITLKNAAATPSIALANKGVDIDPNAVRITSYYGTGYNYFSQGTDNKWSAEVLAVNKANGYQLYDNVSGSTNQSYWCATVVVLANGFTAENIILENSFNQYISLKESDDIVEVTNASPSGGVRPTTYGDTSVQDRSLGYVERAAAIGVVGDKTILNNCRIVGRQDSFYGQHNSRIAIYKGAIMGAVDYLFGGMIAVFYQSDLVLNTSDSGSDVAYITAAQHSGGRGYLMYECNIKSAEPGVETASTNYGKPGYFGRPWAATTSEVVFYNTNIDESQNPSYIGQSMILPEGWRNSLGGESEFMYEYGSIEGASGVDNSGSRASWSTVLSTPVLNDGTEITLFNFTKGNDGWDPFAELALGVEDVIESSTAVKVQGYNNRIYISNVKSSAKVNIYSLSGTLIRSIKTNSDTDFSFRTGLYVVTIKDEEGQKALKLIVH
ncbi:pectinesterase family protein [Flavisericum labens]|uniref:pectinesterase family protein n=1 Tax=Flavisericum labens TaxID=3377112 RepID=UPI00387B397F